MTPSASLRKFPTTGNRSALLIAGLKAAALGAGVGTSLPTLFTLAVGGSMVAEGRVIEGVWMAVLPFVFGAAFALAGLIVIGTPLTWWLAGRREESAAAYLSAGLCTGAAIPVGLIWLVLGEGMIEVSLGLAVFGAATGGATGYFWWRLACKAKAQGDHAALAAIFE
jgi:hypothetical protein